MGLFGFGRSAADKHSKVEERAKLDAILQADTEETRRLKRFENILGRVQSLKFSQGLKEDHGTTSHEEVVNKVNSIIIDIEKAKSIPQVPLIAFTKLTTTNIEQYDQLRKQINAQLNIVAHHLSLARDRVVRDESIHDTELAIEKLRTVIQVEKGIVTQMHSLLTTAP